MLNLNMKTVATVIAGRFHQVVIYREIERIQYIWFYLVLSDVTNKYRPANLTVKIYVSTYMRGIPPFNIVHLHLKCRLMKEYVQKEED